MSERLRVASGIVTMMLGFGFGYLQAQTLQSAGPDVALSYDLSGKPIPVWSGGALLVRDSNTSANPVVHVFTKDGFQLSETSFAIPGASTVQTRSVARGADGTLALCGIAFSSDGKVAPFISVSSADGTNQQVLRTDPLYPNAISIASDGSLWIAGEEVVGGRETNFDHGMVRHLDRSGKVIETFLPRSLYPQKMLSPASDTILSIVGSRIGFVSSSAKEYFEISNGTVVRVPISPIVQTSDHIMGLALTEDGKSFLGIYSASKKTYRIAMLQPGNTQWRVLPATNASSSGMLYGASGDTLIAGTKTTLRSLQLAP